MVTVITTHSTPTCIGTRTTRSSGARVSMSDIGRATTGIGIPDGDGVGIMAGDGTVRTIIPRVTVVGITAGVGAVPTEVHIGMATTTVIGTVSMTVSHTEGTTIHSTLTAASIMDQGLRPVRAVQVIE